ncbi:phage integrase family protein [Paraburkholderia oxyphila]|uniref:phage integrase family protein n=1 Tax=Paraburkholderia oxyphila TaxID=614212 RepID=UPI000A060FED|nr:phage integrase family protein [Paraburkholderia oxyphila]
MARAGRPGWVLLRGGTPRAVPRRVSAAGFAAGTSTAGSQTRPQCAAARAQASALARTEAALALDPRPEDPLDTWFDPALAARLTAAGLATLADLLALIRGRLPRWFAEVPHLGQKGARRGIDWLDLHAASRLDEPRPPRHTVLPIHASSPFLRTAAQFTNMSRRYLTGFPFFQTGSRIVKLSLTVITYA